MSRAHLLGKPLAQLALTWLLLTLFISSAWAESKPFLWQVQSPTGEEAYLFGTIHSGNPVINRLPAVVNKAFTRSDIFVAEIDFNPQGIQRLQQLMLNPKRPVKDVLGPARVQQASQLLAAMHPNLSVDLFAGMQLWAFVAQFATIEDQVRFPNQTAMDMQLYQQAQQRGMPTLGLETVDEQAGIFTQFSETELLAILDANMAAMEQANQRGETQMQALYKAYASGDSATFDTLMDEQVPLQGELAAKLDRLLITDRNTRMSQRIIALMQQQQGIPFIAIGAGHYDPESGVQQQLRQQGFKVKRLP